MKKIITIIALAAASFSSFGQGYFSFTGNPRFTWNGFSTPSTSLNSASLNVGFLFGSTASTALITGVQSSVSTNATSANQSWTAATAWSAILNDANFAVAKTNGVQVVQAVAANGSWSFNGGVTFGVDGSAAQAYKVIVLAWDKNYATAALAAAAGAAVGWSSAFTYTAVSSIGTPTTMATAGLTGFGTALPAVVPEPGTMALAALGGASLLLFRRKNK